MPIDLRVAEVAPLRTRRAARRAGILGALVALVALLFATSASAATTIEVTNAGDAAGATCPSTTACTLRAAVSDADTIGGTVTIDLDAPGSIPYTFSHGTVTTGTIDLTLLINGNNAATINAAGVGATQVFADHGEGGSTTFQNLTISGMVSGNYSGIQDTSSAALNFINVVFSGDDASTDVTNFGATGSLTFTGDSFAGDNSANAAIQTTTGGTFSDLTFTSQTGPAILAGFGPITVRGLTLIGGSNPDATPPPTVLPAVQLASNGASSSIDGLDVEGLTSTAGPTVQITGPWSSIDDLTVAGNTVPDQYAGVQLALTGAAVSAQNWTIAHNTVSTRTASLIGGGVGLTSGQLNLTFATIDGNSALGDGDDLYATGTGTVLSVGDSILNGTAANAAQECAADPDAAITSLGHNIDFAGTCLKGASDLDGVAPLLMPLTAHSGANPAPNVEPLGYGSPAVNAVPVADCPAADEDGTTRPQGTGCDIGAFEALLTKLSIGITGAPATATAGTPVTYTVTAANASATTPASAVLTDSLPTGATFSSANVVVGGGAPQGCTGTTTVTCAVGALQRGEQAVATITAILQSTGSNVDSATVSSELPDANDSSDATSATTVVSTPPSGGGGVPSTGGGPGGTGTGNPPGTGSTTPGPTPPPVAPTLSALSLSPARFVADAAKPPKGAKTGATLTVTDTAAGPVTITVTRSAKGVKSGKSCVAPRPHPAHRSVACVRILTVGSETLTAVAGVNHLHFGGRLAGKALPAGSYSLHAVAESAGKASGSVQAAAFSIVVPPPPRSRRAR